MKARDRKPLPPRAKTGATPPGTDQSQQAWVILLLALMMFMAPAMGVPSEEMLQDTLKSIVIAWGTLAACFVYFWLQRSQPAQLTWHWVLALPLVLAAYALGSMAWSHTFLAAVEAIRWLLLGLIAWLVANAATPTQVARLAWGIHWGACVASLWTALQFWFDFSYFPQGPNPASTFVNRNFFAEFAVCTLPFTLFLLTREKQLKWVYALAATLAFNLVAVMMTGTRSALLAVLLLMALLVIILYAWGKQLASAGWSHANRLAVPFFVAMMVLGLGLIPTQNTHLIAENNSGNAIDKAFNRTLSMTKSAEYSEGSFSIRAVMWKATGRMISAHPVAGIGAGAWEVEAPLYQTAGTQLETDFYAHNEILQLLAEYGLAGWVFLLGLLAYLAVAAWRTWTNTTPDGLAEAPLRAFTLSSLVVFLLVSNAGFPWRLAATGALFAVCLGVLAASDIRLHPAGFLRPHVITCKPTWSKIVLSVVAALIALTLYVTYQTWQTERKLVRAIKLALTITKSGQPNNPNWNTAKADLLQLIKEGIAINPHYRKLTPMAADELANWGDWANATWIWESVLASRPHVVAIAANISRGYLQTGDLVKAQEFFERARKLQPTAPAVRSLQVLLLNRLKRYDEAAAIAREQFAANQVDYDLVYAAYLTGIRSQDWALAIQALTIRIQKWPSEAVDGWLKLADVHHQSGKGGEALALESYQRAIEAAPESQRDIVLAKIPENYRTRLQQALLAPAGR